MVKLWVVRLGGLLAASTLVFGFAPAAIAQSGPGGDSGATQSTPGVTVTAQNPGTSPGSRLRLTLVAHSGRSQVINPDCRPATKRRPPPTLRCWGTLLLRAPDAGGLTVTGFQEVHKVAVAETNCGDDHGGDCDGDEGGGSCDDSGGCEDGGLYAVATGQAGAEPVQAQVNGIATVTDPGTTTMTAGQTVQVQITLYDNSTALYQDQVLIQVRPKGPNQNSIPWAYESGLQTIQQVDVHYRGNSG